MPPPTPSRPSPHSPWPGTPLPDPRTADPVVVREAVLAVIAREGPLTLDRLDALWSQFGEGGAPDALARTLLHEQLQQAIDDRQVERHTPVAGTRSWPTVLRLPDQPRFAPRRRGARLVDHVPIDEVASHLDRDMSVEDAADALRQALDKPSRELGDIARDALEFLENESFVVDEQDHDTGDDDELRDAIAKCAGVGDVAATFMLGVLTADEDPEQLEVASELLARAAGAGELDAIGALVRLQGLEPHIDLVREAADAGDGWANFQLVSDSSDANDPHLSAAARAGFPEARRTLARALAGVIDPGSHTSADPAADLRDALIQMGDEGLPLEAGRRHVRHAISMADPELVADITDVVALVEEGLVPEVDSAPDRIRRSHPDQVLVAARSIDWQRVHELEAVVLEHASDEGVDLFDATELAAFAPPDLDPLEWVDAQLRRVGIATEPPQHRAESVFAGTTNTIALVAASPQPRERLARLDALRATLYVGLLIARADNDFHSAEEAALRALIDEASDTKLDDGLRLHAFVDVLLRDPEAGSAGVSESILRFEGTDEVEVSDLVFDVAAADGALTPSEEAEIRRVCRALGLEPESLVNRLRTAIGLPVREHRMDTSGAADTPQYAIPSVQAPLPSLDELEAAFAARLDEAREASMLPEASQGTLVGGRYRIDGLSLGADGSIRTFPATDTKATDDARDVVARLYANSGTTGADAAVRYAIETAVASCFVDHDAIAEVLDFGLDASTGTPFIVRPRRDYTLRELVARHGLTLDRAIQLAERMCAALEALESVDIIHGALTPDRVLVDRPVSHPELIDPAIGRYPEERVDAILALHAEAPDWFPPEYADGTASSASDAYLLGKLLGFLIDAADGPAPTKAQLGIVAAELTAVEPEDRPSLTWAHNTLSRAIPHVDPPVTTPPPKQQRSRRPVTSQGVEGVIGRLSFKDAEPLPAWASTLLRVGHEVASFAGVGERLLATVVVPYHPGTASLLALGAVIHALQSGTQIDIAESVERIRALVPGTIVEAPIGTHGQTRITGKLVGVVPTALGDSILIEYEGKGAGVQRCYVPLDRAPFVNAFQGEGAAAKHSKDQVALAQAAFGELAAPFLQLRRHDCTVVGLTGAVENDANDMHVIAHGQGGPVAGSVADLCRMSGSKMLRGRVAVVPGRGANARKHPSFHSRPDLVVFTGPEWYAKWGQAPSTEWRHANTIVIADGASRLELDHVAPLEQDLSNAPRPWTPPAACRGHGIEVRGAITKAKPRRSAR